jgi:hypothetical protein
MIITVLAWIGGAVVVAWLLIGLFLLRMEWLNAAWDQQERAKHADVDQLARKARALSSRRARVERWHDLPTADEWGV